MDEVRYYNSSMTLEEAEQYIQSGLITAARAYVANGYYLRRIRDDKLFEEAGYQNFEDYVRGKYNKDKGWASKCIKVNQQLSEEGNSPILSKQYLEYSTYQLVELAYMSEEQREEVNPDMTVNQLKQIRKPEEAVEVEKSCDVTTFEPKEKEQDLEEGQEPEESQDRAAHVKEQYRLQKSFLYPFAAWLIKNHKTWFMEDHMSRVIHVGKSEPQLKAYLGASQSGFRSFGFPVGDDTYYAKMYDDGIEISHFTDTGFTVTDGMSEWFYLAASVQVQWNVVVLEEVQKEQRQAKSQEQEQQPESKRESSKFNSTPTSCPHRKEYSCTVLEENRSVPGDGSKCGSSCCWICKFQGKCKLECNASAGRDGSFPEYDAAWLVREWAKRSPGDLKRVLEACRKGCTNAERAKAAQEEISPYGAHCCSCWEYDFSFHGFAGGIDFRIGKVDIHLKYGRFVQELMNLYPDFEERVSKGPENVIEEPENEQEQAETVSDSPETVIDGEYVEVPPEQELSARSILEEEKTELHNWIKVYQNEGLEMPPMVERQKIIVAALTAMVAELEKPDPEKQEQPELPILKNNDQRAAFVDAYEAWPLWIETEQTGERYYRYDLPDGTSIVVKVYHAMLFNYKGTGKYENRFHEGYGRHEYYLLREGKFFRDCETNRSNLVDVLKELQKKK